MKPGVRLPGIPEDLLAHELGPAVRVGAAQREGLFQRHFLNGPVHRGGGRKDDVKTPVLLHDFQQRQRRVQVVPVIHERLGHGLAHRLEAGEMNDLIDLVLGKHLFKVFSVGAVPYDQRRFFPGELLYPGQGFRACVAEIVQHDHVFAAV